MTSKRRSRERWILYKQDTASRVKLLLCSIAITVFGQVSQYAVAAQADVSQASGTLVTQGQIPSQSSPEAASGNVPQPPGVMSGPQGRMMPSHTPPSGKAPQPPAVMPGPQGRMMPSHTPPSGKAPQPPGVMPGPQGRMMPSHTPPSGKAPQPPGVMQGPQGRMMPSHSQSDKGNVPPPLVQPPSAFVPQ